MMETNLFYVAIAGVVIVLAALAWWSRKATRYPEYAARKEAEVDAMLESLKKYAPDQVDAVLSKIQSVDAVAGGQALYKLIERRLNSIETKLDEVRKIYLGK